MGRCLEGSNVSVDYRRLGHNIWHCPKITRIEGDIRCTDQPYPSCGLSDSGAYATNLIRFYALHARGEQDCPPYIVPGICYTYLDSGVDCLL